LPKKRQINSKKHASVRQALHLLSLGISVKMLDDKNKDRQGRKNLRLPIYKSIRSYFAAPVCWVAFTVLLLSACGSDEFYRPSAQNGAFADREYDRDLNESASPLSAPEAPVEPAAAQPAATPARLLHYSAQLRLLVSQQNKAIENAMHLAESVGGYIESIKGNTVVMQVPADRFEEALTQAQNLGKVLDRRVATEDISESYYDSELRLKIAKQSRDRLLQLLEIAKDEEDKIELLVQLERINTVIHRLESSLELLKKKVRYSEISLQFQTLQDVGFGENEQELAGFAWIAALAQFADSSCRNKDLQFTVPDNMLRIEHIDYWRVESADEVVFQTCQHDNNPHGDSEFWLQATKFRMLKRFSQIEEFKQGQFALLRLSGQQKDAPVFYVGLLVKWEKISVLEIKFPTQPLEQKHKQAILKVIAEKSAND